MELFSLDVAKIFVFRLSLFFFHWPHAVSSIEMSHMVCGDPPLTFGCACKFELNVQTMAIA